MRTYSIPFKYYQGYNPCSDHILVSICLVFTEDTTEFSHYLFVTSDGQQLPATSFKSLEGVRGSYIIASCPENF